MNTKCLQISRLLIMCCITNLVNPESGIEFRMVGGSAAGKAEFPFAVSVQIGGRHICGGSLVAKEWVLTAAVCVDGNQGPVEVVAGADKLDSEDAAVIPVSYIVVHEDYNPDYLSNNMALLKLNQMITESKSIEIVEMRRNYIEAPEDCIAIGWGYSKYPESSISNALLSLKTKTLTMEDCQLKLKEAAAVFASDICTFNKADQGYCLGDVGSPLVIKSEKKFKLIAVVNWGVPCAKGYPDVSSRISYFYDWIKFVLDNY